MVRLAAIGLVTAFTEPCLFNYLISVFAAQHRLLAGLSGNRNTALAVFSYREEGTIRQLR
ncbi:hypothetical protein TYRP_008692 [Tyrophagus putrescentiae]|nr:hypothetical protein TYRP_008692 [Tyrophagus putrescentiae]